MMGVSAQTALRVTVSGDGMQAIIRTQIPLESGVMAEEEIREVLLEAGVCTGMTVTGEVVPCPPAEPAQLIPGLNTAFGPDGTTVVATELVNRFRCRTVR